MRDVRFRRALSLAIDRDELNEVVYIGLAKPSNNTIMQRSVLFKPEYAKQVGELRSQAGQQAARRGRPHQAQRPGLPPAARRPAGDHRGRACQRGDRGRRRAVADRRPMEEGRHQAAVQAADPRELPPAHLLRRGDHDRLCRRHDRGADADTSPKEFAPTMQGGLQWSRWGMFIEIQGQAGREVRHGGACKLLDYVKEWEHATDEAERRKAWEKILETNADQVFSIGTVNGIRQPIVVGPEGPERAQGRLLRLGSGRIYRPLPARHVLAGAVAVTRHATRLLRRRHYSVLCAARPTSGVSYCLYVPKSLQARRPFDERLIVAVLGTWPDRDRLSRRLRVRSTERTRWHRPRPAVSRRPDRTRRAVELQGA